MPPQRAKLSTIEVSHSSVYIAAETGSLRNIERLFQLQKRDLPAGIVTLVSISLVAATAILSMVRFKYCRLVFIANNLEGWEKAP